MKQTFLIAALALASIAAQGQTVRFGVQAGGNLNSIRGFDKAKVGYEAGAFAEYQGLDNRGFFAQVGLSFVKTKWTVTLEDEEGNYGHLDCSPAYLQMPLYAGYKWAIGREARLSLAGGGYAAYGLYGKGETLVVGGLDANGGAGSWDDLFEVEKINNVFKEGARRFDWGLGVRLGAEIDRHWRVTLTHQWSFRRFTAEKTEIKVPSGFAKNSIFSLSVGYTF